MLKNIFLKIKSIFKQVLTIAKYSKEKIANFPTVIFIGFPNLNNTMINKRASLAHNSYHFISYTEVKSSSHYNTKIFGSIKIKKNVIK